MAAHVICCNDSVEYVFNGAEEDAMKKLEELSRLDWERRYRGIAEYRNFADYRRTLYWHIHTVPSNTVKD